jgi:hypothetical protein
MSQAVYDEGLKKKITRLRALLVVGNTSAPHIQVEIADLKTDILGSGVTEAELADRTAPGVSVY